jgi:hypothetical protein
MPRGKAARATRERGEPRSVILLASLAPEGSLATLATLTVGRVAASSALVYDPCSSLALLRGRRRSYGAPSFEGVHMRVQLIFGVTAGAALVAVVACGSGDDEVRPATDATDAGANVDGPTSDGGSEAAADGGGLAERGGARIKLTVETTADGFRSRVGLYDAQLDVACGPGLASDGAQRCLPVEARTAETFMDATCTHRVAPVPTCDAKPKYAIAYSHVKCAIATQRVFETGAKATPTTLYVDGPSGCQPAEPVSAAYDYFEVAEVAATAFATIESGTRSLVPGLDAAYYESADGLHVLQGLRDIAHGALACDFSNAADNRERCLPLFGSSVSALTTLYADPSCTSDVATSLCGSLSLAARYVGGCPAHQDFYAVGPPLAPDAGVFQKSGQSCLPSSTTFEAQVVTHAIAPDEFVAATLVSSTASTRLRIDPLEVAPDVRLTTTSLAPTRPIRDADNGAFCVPRTASDGKTRCLPIGGAYAEAFADDQCTTRVAYVFTPACDVPKFAQVIVTARPECAAYSTSIFPLLGKRASTVTYARSESSSACVVQDFGATADIYDVGPEVAPTAFVEVTTVHE